MADPFQDDGLGHFPQELTEWDPNLDLFDFVGEQFTNLDHDFSYGAGQRIPSPSMSPLPLVPQAVTAPATPAPPTPASFKPLPSTAGDPYDTLSIGYDGASEAPLSEYTGEPSQATQSVISSAEDEQQTINNHDGNERHASHGRVSMGVK